MKYHKNVYQNLILI